MQTSLSLTYYCHGTFFKPSNISKSKTFRAVYLFIINFKLRHSANCVLRENIKACFRLKYTLGRLGKIWGRWLFHDCLGNIGVVVEIVTRFIQMFLFQHRSTKSCHDNSRTVTKLVTNPTFHAEQTETSILFPTHSPKVKLHPNIIKFVDFGAQNTSLTKPNLKLLSSRGNKFHKNQKPIS